MTDEKTPDKASTVEEEQIKEKEADRILSHIKEDAFVVTLEIAGKKLDSVSFADLLEQKGVHGISHIQFVIGGSLGLHQKVCQRRGSFKDI